MITEEEKKAGMWEFNGTKFKKCPQCNKGIPAEWKSHQCGWGKEIQTQLPVKSSEEIQLTATAMVGESLEDAQNILSNFWKDGFTKQDIINVADQIRRTKLFLSGTR